MSSGDRMPPELDATADALSAAWNTLVRGEPIDATAGAASPFTPTLRRLHAIDDAPGLSPERQARIWRDFMASQTVDPAVIVLGPVPPTSANGQAPGNDAGNPRASRQRWSARFLATAAAVALMLVSVLLTIGLRQPNRWLGTGNVPGVLADEIVFHWRLDAIPGAMTRASVHRDTLAPSAVWEQGTYATSGVGPMLYRVESGAVTARADGTMQVTRRGSALPSSIPAGTAVDLAPGDAAFLPARVASEWRNPGTAPATVLDAGLTDIDASGNQPQTLRVAVIAGAPAQLPAAPADLTLRRLTLAPGAVLPRSITGGLHLVGVDAGTLEIGWARPAVADAIVGTRRLEAGAWGDLDSGGLFAGELRNPGAAPLTLMLLTVAPIPIAPATPTAVETKSLLSGRFDAIPADATWIGVERYTAPPGAAWTQGTAAMSGIGPMLYRIERGAVTVQTDGTIDVTRVGEQGPTHVQTGSTVTLASGDVAYMPSGVVTRWRNDGAEPADIFDGGITTVGAADVSMLKPYTQPINDWGVAPPKAPVAFAVQRVTVAPGATLRREPAAGMTLLAVESGTVEIVWSQPIADALQAPAAAPTAAAPKQLGADHWVDLQLAHQFASELRNAGSRPLVMLLVSAAPAVGAPADSSALAAAP